ncbi:MAG: bifunctional DNA-formamidopyrimidine glycosylase/DNA-(apurinic or apyrimidinic site) lyase [Candidatus Pacebacteria bacterium]|nr:bifunctional DNA-formamidopyrimidine glycosylase/DNA-(apurinic or apyrimidinic site) lyase [Candidatus Paceibacterota bacterium]
MPELPEVETVKRRLAQVLVDKTVAQVQVRRSKSFSGQPAKLQNQTIQEVSRRAKLLVIKFSAKLFLLIHLKMTGQLIYLQGQNKLGGGHPTADWTKELPTSHTRVIIDFTDQSQLFFNDMRVFGWLKLLTKAELKQELAKYGPDVIDSDVTADYFISKLAKTSRKIKQVIMDYRVIAGIGNIYACEALNMAQVSPLRPANQLNKSEIEQLFQAMKQVINQAIKAGGTTFDGHYVDVDGLSGRFQDQLRVYGQTGQSCPNCGAEIKKIKIAGRGTYYCAECQQ